MLLLVVALVGGMWLLRRRLISYVDGPPVEPDPTPWPAAGPDEPELEPSWVDPCDGGCPESHPVKVKLSSHLFHLPGMLAYQRTHPDRCYRSAEDASADGFQRAKR
jgi:hypothetical protein